jgi:hypothetical protein
VHFVWYQSLNHPELSTPAGDERSKAEKYDVGGFWPTAFFDGFYRAPVVDDINAFYGVFDNMIGQARSLTTVMEMSLDSAATGLDSGELRVGVHITPTDSSVNSMAGLMLAAVVFEDSAPFYSMLQGDTAYARYCARRVIGDTWGVPLALRFGNDFDTVLTTPLGPWNPAHVGVAVFVQDTSSLRVLQSVGRRRLTD